MAPLAPRTAQGGPLEHISDSAWSPNCNYTGERLLETTVVQLRGEPTTTANLRMARGGDMFALHRLCLIPSNLVLHTQVAASLWKRPRSFDSVFLARY